MAITRGQMQRQLRRGGGIMNIAPREQFGLGSKLKKAVRKIIPNEVAKIATVAAPFVAPFNPALAGAMAGIGSFDQTGSLSDAFKRGALTYGGGQLARYAGGAGFQGNPFASGGAFTPSGFTAGFSSPLGTDTGIGKLLNDRRQQAIGKQIAEQGQLNREVANIGQVIDSGGLETGATIVDPSVVSETVATTVTESAPKSVVQLIKNQDYGEAAKVAAEKGFNAVFKTPVRNDAGKIVGYDLDKTALLAAGAFGLSYLDAKKIADEAGVDIGTETEYDEATKAEKKDEYAGYLTNFFEGKKDGGRIGFNVGSPDPKSKPNGEYKETPFYGDFRDELLEILEELKKMDKDKKAQGGRIGYMFGDKVEDKEGIMSMSEDKEDENMKMAYFPGDVFSKAEISRLFSDKSLRTNQDRKQLFRILMNPGMFPEAEDMLKKLLRGKQDGGRIGFENGTIPMADSSFKFMELVEDDTDEKEKLINALLDNAREKFPKASEEDIFNFVMSQAAPMSGLMVDGKFVRSTDIETPSIKLSRDMGGPRYDFLMGGEVPVRKNKAGIEELDYRQTGGFVPIGVKEKADDVPAMLSKNEFVLTADAVRGIGGGDVEKGAEKLYGVMKQAEKVGRA